MSDNDRVYGMTIEVVWRTRHPAATNPDQLVTIWPERELLRHTTDNGELQCEWLIFDDCPVEAPDAETAVELAIQNLTAGDGELIEVIVHDVWDEDDHTPSRPVTDVVVRDGLL